MRALRNALEISAVVMLRLKAAARARKGNKAAGTRARKGLQDLKKLAQDIRLEIQAKKNAG